MRWTRTPSLLLATLLVACSDAPPVERVPSSSFRSATPEDRAAAAARAMELAEIFARADSTLQVGSVAPGDTVRSQGAGDSAAAVAGHAWTFRLDEASRVAVHAAGDGGPPLLSLFRGEPGSLGTLLILGNPDREAMKSLPSLALDTGTYTVMATPVPGASFDPYTLSLQVEASGVAGGPGLLAPGSRAGRLDASDPLLPDSSRFDAWLYQGDAGEHVTVTVTSAVVDASLALLEGSGPDGGFIAEAGEGSGASGARLSVVLPVTGPYTVVVSSADAAVEGDYELRVETDPGRGRYAFDNASASTDRYALLVGIEDYPGDDRDLPGALEDAMVMRRLLLSRFGFAEENIAVLTDADATRENLANGVLEHLGQAGPQGMAVLFFSGRGTRTLQDLGLRDATEPGRGVAGDEALLLRAPGGAVSLMLDEELDYLLASLDAGRSLVVLDASFPVGTASDLGGGPGPREADPGDPVLAPNLRLPLNFIAVEPGVASHLSPLGLDLDQALAAPPVLRVAGRHLVWIASEVREPAWSRDAGGGVFTRLLVEQLSSASPSTTLRDLNALVARAMETVTPSGTSASVQRPRLLGEGDTLTVEALFRRR